MNKKAIFFIVPFTILVILLFSYLLILVMTEPASRNYLSVGDVAVEVLVREQEANLQKLFAEKVVEYVIDNSLIDLAEKGGVCEEWTNKECNPKEIEESCIKYFKKNFKDYLDKLQYFYNYDVVLERKSKSFILKFNADELDVSKPGTPTFSMIYTTSHNFDKEIDYDLSIYKELYERYHNLTLKTQECLFKTKFLSDLKVNVECDDYSEENYIKFKVTQDLEFIKPVIKFKLLIPEKLK